VHFQKKHQERKKRVESGEFLKKKSKKRGELERGKVIFAMKSGEKGVSLSGWGTLIV